MASVLLSDVIIPDVYLSYQAVNSPERSALVTAGIAVTHPEIQALARGGGMLGEIPFWNDLDATIEPNYSTENPVDRAVPQKIAAGVMQSRIVFMNQGYSSGDLIPQLAGSNPMQHIRNRFGTYWTRQFQRRIIATLTGVMLQNVATNAGDMVYSVAIEDGANAQAGNVFNQFVFTGAAFTLGDMYDNVTAIAVHSVVYKRMVDNDAITFRVQSGNTTDIPLFLGRRVIVDDTMPVVPGGVSGYKYTTFLFGAGAIGYADIDGGNGTIGPVTPVEVWRDPQGGNGGGVEQLWERKSMIVHPLGFSFTNLAVSAQSATNADCRNAVNWTRKVVRKNVPLAFIVTNG